MDKTVISALQTIDCKSLTYAEWITVGMALKGEGCDVSVWDAWSRADAARYHPGECEQRWATFHGADRPVTGGTIVRMAMERGWRPEAAPPDEFDPTEEEEKTPSEQLIAYLKALFRPEERVGYVTEATQSESGKWQPSKGVYDRTAGELIDALTKHPDDVGAAIGDWPADAGAWIRINPLNGEGVRNADVTRFDHALVESDDMTPGEQAAMYVKLNLPVAALVYSGGRSVHAVVKVNASDPEDYRRRVTKLYDILQKHGLSVDRQNNNPSRLSRMPGVTRGAKRQILLCTNRGCSSFEEWLRYMREDTASPPKPQYLSDAQANPPPVPEELIGGVLRRGHKMLVAGSSKAGKSFLLMELAVDIATGGDWLGFPCRKGRVMYVNLEIDTASCVQRFGIISQALGRDPGEKSILLWNLRGHAEPLDKLVPDLIEAARPFMPDAIIIDPIYKVITGDENSATDMGAFCNQFDRICEALGCAVIYCHHHSKGVQGQKRAMDRASGSGVFARDPDAVLDIIELELSERLKRAAAERGATAWRMEGEPARVPQLPAGELLV